VHTLGRLTTQRVIELCNILPRRELQAWQDEGRPICPFAT